MSDTVNCTENYTKYKISKETIEDIKRQSLKKTAYNKNRCSNKLPSLPPNQRRDYSRKRKGYDNNGRVLFLLLLVPVASMAPASGD